MRSRSSVLRRSALLTLGAAVFLAGCHTYTAVDSPAVGSTVRVQVPVRSALDPENGAPRFEAVQGQLLSGGDTLVLSVVTRREFGAYRELVQYDTLRLSQSQASRIEVREFSTGRSIALGALIAVGATTAAVYAFGLEGGSSGPDDGLGQPQTAIVISSSIVSKLVGTIFR